MSIGVMFKHSFDNTLKRKRTKIYRIIGVPNPNVLTITDGNVKRTTLTNVALAMNVRDREECSRRSAYHMLIGNEHWKRCSTFRNK